MTPARAFVTSRNVFDDLDQLVEAVALLASEVDQLLRSPDDSATFGSSCDGDATPAAELEQPLVAQEAERAEDGVGVDVEDRGEILRGRQALSGLRLSLSDRAADLGGGLLVEVGPVGFVHLDTDHGASNTSVKGFEGTVMDTTRAVRRPDRGGLLRALIEEAWQRASRRRRMYAGVAFSIAVTGAIIVAALQGYAASQGGSPAVLAGAGAQVPPFVSAGESFLPPPPTGTVFLHGRRGRATVVMIPRHGTWEIPQRGNRQEGTGQYVQLRGGGRRIDRGGWKSAWQTRLVGYLRRKGHPRQHVVIKLQGFETGTFVITPTEQGAIKRDSGTHYSGWRG